MSSYSGITGAISNLFSLKQLRFGKNVPVFLPFYHLVSDRTLAFRNNYNYPSVKRFEKDLDFILKYFTPVTLHDLAEGRYNKNSFHLSFDDGLRQCYDIVFPVLKRKGIPATFFLNPAFVDNKDIFHRYKASILIEYLKEKSTLIELNQTYADIESLDQMAEDIGIDWKYYLDKEKPYMSLSQIKQMLDEGFSFGAHSWDHPEFWLLDPENQIEEIKESISWVTQTLNPEIKAFAFPFTDYRVPDEVFIKIREQKICDLSFGTAGIKREIQPGHFQRLPMENERANNAKQIIKNEYFSFHLKKLVNKQFAKRT